MWTAAQDLFAEIIKKAKSLKISYRVINYQLFVELERMAELE